MPRWKAHFAADDLLFLPYGRVARDPVGLMREVEDFLGLAPHDYPRLDERVHKTRKLAVPERIVARLADRLETQTAFVRAEFGPDFAR